MLLTTGMEVVQMIDHDKKFIFVHIPKTGGSSIEAIFHPSIITENDICKDIKGKHNTLSNIIKNESLDVLDYFKFSFVRNPWAKILSHYLFFIKGGFDHRNSFVDFVDYYCGRDHQGWKRNDFLPQSDFLKFDGKINMDFIGRFENLKFDFYSILDKVGLKKMNLSHTNKTSHGHYESYYNSRIKKVVEKKYQEDIDEFKYTF